MTPPDGATGVLLGTQVEILFDKDVDRNSATGGGVAMFDGGGNAVPAQVSFRNDRTVLLSPQNLQSLETQYRVAILDLLKDLEGNAAELFDSRYVTEGKPLGAPTGLEALGGNATMPLVLAHGEQAFVAWTNIVESGGDVWVASRAGGSWLPAQNVENATGHAASPLSGIAGSVGTFFTWQQNAPEISGFHLSTIFATFAREGETSFPQGGIVLSGSIERAGQPRVSAASIGGSPAAVLVWAQLLPDAIGPGETREARIHANVFSYATESWLPEIPISEGFSTNPDVAINASTGKAVAVWWQNNLDDPFIRSVWANRLEDPINGIWAGGTEVDGSGEDVVGPPSIAADGQGNVVVVWRQLIAGVAKVHGRQFRGGLWGPVRVVAQGPGESVPLEPKVVSSSPGRFFAIYHEDLEGKTHVRVSRFRSDTGEWSAPESIENYEDGNATRARLAANQNGNALAVWQEGLGGGASRIMMNRFTAGVGWAGPQAIDTNPYSDTSWPYAALKDDGKSLVAFLFRETLEGPRSVAVMQTAD